MKKVLNKFVCFGLLTLVGLVSGCSNGNSSDSKSEEVPIEDVDIFNDEGKTYMHALKAGTSTITTTIENDRNQKLIKEFKIEVKDPTKSKTLKRNSIKDNYACISVKEALDICAKLADGETSEPIYCYGILETPFDKGGNMTLKDDTGSILIYGCDKKEIPTDIPNKGDEVVVNGVLKNYNGKLEFYRPKFVEVKHKETVLPSLDEYETLTISEARKKAPDSLLKVTGVVATITKTQKFTDNGFYLVDDTGSIYVHGNNVASEVKVGNKVSVIAKRVNYISEKEMNNASKFGYQGCLQLAEARIVENDGKLDNEVNYSWCEYSSIEDILNTPMSENITTNIYETDAVIKKVEEKGFTNYYFNNIGEYQGSYVYSSNNGNDFSYLNEFDDKICHVYLSPINCKCTESGTIYRFQPLSVVENPDFYLDDPLEFIYKASTSRFLEESYLSDPVLELSNTYKYDRLGIDKIKINYYSSNPEVITFNTNKESMMEEPEIATTPIGEAITKEDNTVVTIQGVVSGGLVNKTGFYLTDDTGAIAVLCDGSMLEEVSIGDKIFIKGKKIHYNPENCLGQLCINESELIFNAHGDNKINRTSFIKDKSFDEIISETSSDVERSDHMYSVKCKIEVISSQYYTSIALKTLDGAKSISLYCSNAKQYDFLNEFTDKEVTVDFALVNWNKKAAYKGYVLSVYDGANEAINTNCF